MTSLEVTAQNECLQKQTNRISPHNPRLSLFLPPFPLCSGLHHPRPAPSSLPCLLLPCLLWPAFPTPPLSPHRSREPHPQPRLPPPVDPAVGRVHRSARNRRPTRPPAAGPLPRCSASQPPHGSRPLPRRPPLHSNTFHSPPGPPAPGGLLPLPRCRPRLQSPAQTRRGPPRSSAGQQSAHAPPGFPDLRQLGPSFGMPPRISLRPPPGPRRLAPGWSPRNPVARLGRRWPDPGPRHPARTDSQPRPPRRTLTPPLPSHDRPGANFPSCQNSRGHLPPRNQLLSNQQPAPG